MAHLEVHDGTKRLVVSGVPGKGSQPTDADLPRSVGDIRYGEPAYADWDDDWIYPTLLNGWANYDTTHEQARYRKLPGGLVIVEGLVTNGTANTTMFTLPTTHRPALRIIFSGYTGVGNSRLQVNYDNGAVYYPYTGSSTWHSLHCSFWTEG
jgi:hypothetical protein